MRLVAEAVFCGLAAAFSPLHQGFERLPGDGRQAADWWCGMIALPLDAADLDRLGKFLGMLGSDHMGERAAAALKADALVKNAGATWTGLIDALKRAPREPAQDQSHARRDYARSEEHTSALQSLMRSSYAVFC